jgi:hypothetical protein
MKSTAKVAERKITITIENGSLIETYRDSTTTTEITHQVIVIEVIHVAALHRVTLVKMSLVATRLRDEAERLLVMQVNYPKRIFWFKRAGLLKPVEIAMPKNLAVRRGHRPTIFRTALRRGKRRVPSQHQLKVRRAIRTGRQTHLRLLLRATVCASLPASRQIQTLLSP